MSVTVYLDGSPVVVPERVESLWAARGALGIPRGIAFGVETNVRHNGMVKRGWCLIPDPDAPADAGWEFEEGQLYKTFGLMEVIEGGMLDADEDDEDPADWWKRAT